jgi:glycosyltransferase involved in cell wall biosynthesis
MSFVIPSLYEGGPITLLEAMNMRKPVVGTPVGLMGDVIQDQLVPVADSGSLAEKVSILLQDPKLARMMGEKGWELVQQRHVGLRTAVGKHIPLPVLTMAGRSLDNFTIGPSAG